MALLRAPAGKASAAGQAVKTPVQFSEKMADLICERLANGESLTAICTGDAMPTKVAVFKWLARYEDFRIQYAAAREAQADVLADEVLAISDDGRNDWMDAHGREDRGYVTNGENVQRSRLRVDARKWYAAKLSPKKYGDAVRQELTGANGAPLVPVLNVTISGTQPRPAPEAGPGAPDDGD
jgi:hypothetical protein